MPRAFIPVFGCECGPLLFDARATALECRACRVRIARDGNLFRCLDEPRRHRLAPFLDQYRVVRERDGYRSGRAEYYRGLPFTDRHDPQAAVWRIRRRSFARLCRLLPRRDGTPAAVLDLGAGCGWLSNRLTLAGWRAVAVDLLADDRDGLGACAHYAHPIACLEADFDALPLARGQFDAVVFNGSLHYAPDVRATLRRAARLLRAGGVLAVVDSPTFERDADGRAMLDRQRRRLHAEYGVRDPVQPGTGFVTFGDLSAFAREAGRTPRFVSSDAAWRRWARRLPGRRESTGFAPPAFGVWIAA